MCFGPSQSLFLDPLLKNFYTNARVRPAPGKLRTVVLFMLSLRKLPKKLFHLIHFKTQIHLYFSWFSSPIPPHTRESVRNLVLGDGSTTAPPGSTTAPPDFRGGCCACHAQTEINDFRDKVLNALNRRIQDLVLELIYLIPNSRYGRWANMVADKASDYHEAEWL